MYLHIQIDHFSQGDIKVTVVLIIISTLGMGTKKERGAERSERSEEKKREIEKKVDICKHLFFYSNIYFPTFFSSVWL